MACNDFINAARRKVAIIEFHLDCLERAISDEPDRDPVPIPVQAHFEGVLSSFAACADQIAAGLHAVTGAGWERIGLGQFLVQFEPKTGPLLALQELWRSSERRDASEVRRLATHFYYEKYKVGDRYRVDTYTPDPIAPRDLVSYGRVVLDLASDIANPGSAALLSVH